MRAPHALPVVALLLVGAALGCADDASRFVSPSPSRDAAVPRDVPVDAPASVDAPPADGCAPRETCGNDLDDDCDGVVDGGCPCVPATVEPCSLGAPPQAGIGQCRAGTHRCVGTGEFGQWGACEGGLGPSVEVCDGLDNDCDGAADEAMDCQAGVTCPGPGDPRVPDGRPFAPYPLHAADFFTRPARDWRWEVRGGPCAAYLPTTTFTLTGGDTADAVFTPRLSGDYTVTLAVTLPDGTVARCVFVVHVAGPGLRVELCWDTNTNVDLDLYVHAPDDDRPWFSGRDGALNTLMPNTSCNAFNCLPRLQTGFARPDWGFAASALAECERGPRGDDWRALGACPNPRLDIDNNTGVSSRGLPENVNVDAPRDGQRFRVMVENFSGGPARPMVNVYCGGRLRATAGAPPDVIADFLGEDGLHKVGTMWRALDVTTRVDASGATDCDVAPLHPPGGAAGYWITPGDPSY